MLCLSTPAAPSLAQTFSQAATSSFDAVDQRQHHTLRPYASFHPIIVCVLEDFSALCSPCGHYRRCLCFRIGHRASTFLPPLPRRGFATHAFHREIGQSRQQYYEGSDSSRTSPVRKASPVHLSCRPSIQSPKHVAQLYVTFPYHPRAHNRFLAVPGFATTPRARRYAPPKRVCYPAGCSFALRLLPTPSRATRNHPALGDAVAFGYMYGDF